MPIYEYRCQQCRREFEELVRGSRPQVKCPDCSSKKVQRLMSAAAVKTASGFRSTKPSGGCHSCSGGSCHSCK